MSNFLSGSNSTKCSWIKFKFSHLDSKKKDEPMDDSEKKWSEKTVKIVVYVIFFLFKVALKF